MQPLPLTESPLTKADGEDIIGICKEADTRNGNGADVVPGGFRAGSSRMAESPGTGVLNIPSKRDFVAFI
jgi:hypothetical protein